MASLSKWESWTSKAVGLEAGEEVDVSGYGAHKCYLHGAKAPSIWDVAVR